MLLTAERIRWSVIPTILLLTDSATILLGLTMELFKKSETLAVPSAAQDLRQLTGGMNHKVLRCAQDDKNLKSAAYLNSFNSSRAGRAFGRAYLRGDTALYFGKTPEDEDGRWLKISFSPTAAKVVMVSGAEDDCFSGGNFTPTSLYQRTSRTTARQVVG